MITFSFPDFSSAIPAAAALPSFLILSRQSQSLQPVDMVGCRVDSSLKINHGQNLIFYRKEGSLHPRPL